MNRIGHLLILALILRTSFAHAQHTSLNVSVAHPSGSISTADLVQLFATTPVNVFGGPDGWRLVSSFNIVAATKTINWSYSTVHDVVILPIVVPLPAVDQITLGTLPAGGYNVNVTWTDTSGLASPFTSGSGALEFVVAPSSKIPGDFTDDGKVDGADYVAWRKNLGGVYIQDHYNLWRANFGQRLAPSSGSSANAIAVVPEPTTMALLFVATCLCCRRLRR